MLIYSEIIFPKFILNFISGCRTPKFDELKELKILAAEKSFKVSQVRYNPGTFIIPLEGNPPETARLVKKAVTRLGLVAQAV
ncbi:MAG: hypothetical protein B5M54_11070, partial [Candidatus Aminicenantes bacterium 4484_214]